MRKPFTLLLFPAAAIIVAAYMLGAYRAGNEQLDQGHRQLQTHGAGTAVSAGTL
ncbi:hypothetical protein [Massilia eburnea]|uniref:hypothetical protein n=1 Tax=Massilia eburnea TaxID=1776165 RepID=UPI003D6B736E